MMSSRVTDGKQPVRLLRHPESRLRHRDKGSLFWLIKIGAVYFTVFSPAFMLQVNRAHWEDLFPFGRT